MFCLLPVNFTAFIHDICTKNGTNAAFYKLSLSGSMRSQNYAFFITVHLHTVRLRNSILNMSKNYVSWCFFASSKVAEATVKETAEEQSN